MEMADIVTRIVEIEGPIHQEEIARRVAALWGLQRAGSRIAATVKDSIKRCNRRDPKCILIEGDFLQ